MEADLRSRLADDAAIKAKVRKASIAWGDRPQASGLPGITLETISDPRPQHMAGLQPLRATQVQVDVWGKDALEAKDIRELAIAAILPAGTVGGTVFRRSFVDGARSSWELTDTGVIYRERVDFTVWHASL